MLVSGMIIGSIFTLFVVPSIYVLLARNHSAVAREEVEAIEDEPQGGELAGAAV